MNIYLNPYVPSQKTVAIVIQLTSSKKPLCGHSVRWSSEPLQFSDKNKWEIPSRLYKLELTAPEYKAEKKLVIIYQLSDMLIFNLVLRIPVPCKLHLHHYCSSQCWCPHMHYGPSQCFCPHTDIPTFHYGRFQLCSSLLVAAQCHCYCKVVLSEMREKQMPYLPGNHIYSTAVGTSFPSQLICLRNTWYKVQHKYKCVCGHW